MVVLGFSGASVSKESVCSKGDLGLILGLGISSVGGHSNPLQYSCLENSHGQRSPEGYSPWDCKESDMTEQLNTHSWLTMLWWFQVDRKGLSQTYMHIAMLPQTPLPSRLPPVLEQSSLCCPAGPCWFSMLNTAVCPCPSRTPWLSLPLSFPPGDHKVITED